MGEASLYENNCFLTLTYDDSHLPSDGGLHKEDLQLFLKRLRKKYGSGIRFFACGEYGSITHRPHYHSLIFNHDFDDRVLFSVRHGNRLFVSEALKALWPFGFSSVGDVTHASASYVARYVVKKAEGRSEVFRSETGDRFQVDKVSGEVLPAEFVQMSRGCKRLGTGGIGRGWLEKYISDVYPHDHVIVGGREHKPPRFFDNLLDKVDPEMLESVVDRRKSLRKYESDDRLLVKEICKKAQIQSLKRGL